MFARWLYSQDIPVRLQCGLYVWRCIRWDQLLRLQVWTVWLWTWIVPVLTELRRQVWLDCSHCWYILLWYRPFIWPHNPVKERYVGLTGYNVNPSIRLRCFSSCCCYCWVVGGGGGAKPLGVYGGYSAGWLKCVHCCVMLNYCKLFVVPKPGFLLEPGRRDLYSAISICVPATSHEAV